VAWQRW